MEGNQWKKPEREKKKGKESAEEEAKKHGAPLNTAGQGHFPARRPAIAASDLFLVGRPRILTGPGQTLSGASRTHPDSEPPSGLDSSPWGRLIQLGVIPKILLVTEGTGTSLLGLDCNANISSTCKQDYKSKEKEFRVSPLSSR